MSKNNKFSVRSILYLENFPTQNAGYCYRVEKWAELLQQKGYSVDIKTLIHSKEELDIINSGGSHYTFIRRSAWKRFFQCLASRKFETVIVRRELLLFNDYGNLFMEKFLLKIHNNVILDFDDDISVSKNQPKLITNRFGKIMMEDGNKFNNSLKLYKRFIVASGYLKDRVKAENSSVPEESVSVIPTCVDYEKYPVKSYSLSQPLVFGWIGGDYNYNQLEIVIPFLNDLYNKYSFTLMVIGGTEFKTNAIFPVVFKKWSLETEVQDLYKIDIGLMPLENNDVSKGKAGFKLIQYMGLGIVSIASAITVNNEIISHLKDSFLVSSESEWSLWLEKVLHENLDLTSMGKEARSKICSKYSFTSNYPQYSKFLCVG